MSLPWLINNNRGRCQMILTEYKHDPKERETKSVYLIRHSSNVQNTTLEQTLTVHNNRYGHFKPTIALDDFPTGLSERESMLKLADWLHRIAVSIEDNWSEP